MGNEVNNDLIMDDNLPAFEGQVKLSLGRWWFFKDMYVYMNVDGKVLKNLFLEIQFSYQVQVREKVGFVLMLC